MMTKYYIHIQVIALKHTRNTHIHTHRPQRACRGRGAQRNICQRKEVEVADLPYSEKFLTSPPPIYVCFVSLFFLKLNRSEP
jgi:hypothetical protein